MFNNGGVCQLCSFIFYGCISCIDNAGITACDLCKNGMFLNGTECSYCSSSCNTCSSELTCTSCPTGYSLTGSSCICSSSSCLGCNSSVSMCSNCVGDIYGNFAGCTTCSPTYYLSSSLLCSPCPSDCVLCDSNADCLSCPYSM